MIQANYSRFLPSVHSILHLLLQSAHVDVLLVTGLDGIITTFAVVASVAGADMRVEVVLVMGFANLFADAVSMAFGEYVNRRLFYLNESSLRLLSRRHVLNHFVTFLSQIHLRRRRAQVHEKGTSSRGEQCAGHRHH